MAVFQIFRNMRMQGNADPVMKFLPYFLCLDSGLILTDILAGGLVLLRLPSDVFLSFLSPLFMISSTVKGRYARMSCGFVAIIELLLAARYLASALGLSHPPESLYCVRMICLGGMFLVMVYAGSVILRVRQVRQVMQSGNVWSCLCLAVDGLYISMMIAYLFILIACHRNVWVHCTLSLLMWLETMALCARISSESVFVLWERQERRIVESMKISSVEMAPGGSASNDNYKEIFDRVVALFENDRIYLKSTLTINEVVKVVFTNKLYISRAISQFTGRNFCQFVNYYRVTHSVRLFRENPDLKVTELAMMSGFNSVVSFTMAFRLYMCDSPGDWCRKERSRLGLKKK